MNKVVIFGATSAIAQSTAKLFAERGDQLYLIGRNPSKLNAIVSDLEVRGRQPVGATVADLDDLTLHEPVIAKAKSFLGSFDIVLLAHGVLGSQESSQNNVREALATIETNFLNPVSILTLVSNELEKQGRGTLAVISSVAGERGRKSNYVYGSSKGGLTVFLSGLRSRLVRSGVPVITLKPGFVDTPMISHLKGLPLVASSERVAQGIVKAIDRKKDTAYLPWFWFWIMAIIRLVPERIFKRLNI